MDPASGVYPPESGGSLGKFCDFNRVVMVVVASLGVITAIMVAVLLSFTHSSAVSKFNNTWVRLAASIPGDFVCVYHMNTL